VCPPTEGLRRVAVPCFWRRIPSPDANRLGFNLTFINQGVPSSVVVIGFDTADMQALYRYGFEKVRAGKLWMRKLPAERPLPAPGQGGNILRANAVAERFLAAGLAAGATATPVFGECQLSRIVESGWLWARVRRW
jgi:hypothetical protein